MLSDYLKVARTYSPLFYMFSPYLVTIIWTGSAGLVVSSGKIVQSREVLVIVNLTWATY